MSNATDCHTRRSVEQTLGEISVKLYPYDCISSKFTQKKNAHPIHKRKQCRSHTFFALGNFRVRQNEAKTADALTVHGADFLWFRFDLCQVT